MSSQVAADDPAAAEELWDAVPSQPAVRVRKQPKTKAREEIEEVHELDDMDEVEEAKVLPCFFQ